MPPTDSDAASWLAAGGTVSAVVVALGQSGYERHLRRKLDGNRYELERRSQAQRISAWYAGVGAARDSEFGPPSAISLLNRSDEPIYEAVVMLVYPGGRATKGGGVARALPR